MPADVLASYFPIPLFDQYVTNIEDAAAVFAAKNKDPRARARKHCLTLRLNVRDAQLGWYTTLSINDDASKKLWEHYADAHDAFSDGNPRAAKALCAAVNKH